jgi:hypothetical protein
MTDRRRHAAPSRHPFPLTQPSAGGGLLLRERKGGGETEASGARPSQDSAQNPPEDNPFAPPPEGTPDQPWQPREPSDSAPSSPSSSDSALGGRGNRWSSRQPGRGNGGFGGQQQPSGRGPNGQDNGEGGPGTGLRWDPTDPVQRRARYALLAGMWAFFFAVFTQREIALLLGALALYWGISSLRGRKKPESSATPSATPPMSTRPQTTAAVSGLVTAGLALAIVAATFTVQMVYRDYYTCVEDSLTKAAQLSCNDELPKSLVPVFGVKE